MRLAENDLIVLKHLLGWADQSFPSGALNIRAQDIAKASGLHRNTVERRMRALREGGVIEGYLFEPHPHLLGLIRAGHTFFGLPAMDTTSFQERLAPFPWISMAALHTDTCFLHTWHAPEDDIDAAVDAVRDTLGARGWAKGFRIGGDAAPALGALDRRLVLALRRGFVRSVADAADTAGTTRRTAARHLAKFADGQVGALMPMFRPAHIDGHLLAVYTNPTWDKDTYPAMAKAFPDRIMGPMAPPTSPMAMVPVTSVEAATALQGVAARSPGLEELQMGFMRDVLFPEACDAWLGQRVQNAPLSAAKP